ncbi:MAG: class I SAM-dependent methyltransferase, partial [Acidimicrobiia bacterium]
AYDRFMGRYSVLLAPHFADLANVSAGQRVLDVGCGPGSLTGELVRRLGSGAVAAVDPSEPFLAAVGERYPGVDAQRATAEELPFLDETFDASLAQLVVHFMKDPVAGLREMQRVTRRQGVVAACVWDFAGAQSPLGPFWDVARRLDPKVEDESHLPGVRQGHLGELFRRSGLDRVEETGLTVAVEHQSFDDWWEPFTLGTGPAGRYLASLDLARQAEMREATREQLPAAPFVVTGRAWAARGIA